MAPTLQVTDLAGESGSGKTSVARAILGIVPVEGGRIVIQYAELGITYLFISHDPGTVRLLADTLVVMHLGRIVEAGPVEQVFAAPRHDYTRALIWAVPSVERIGAARRDMRSALAAP